MTKKKVYLDKIDPEFLRWVKVRCNVDEGGCWEWKQSKNKAQPQGRYLGQRVLVRRVLLGQMAGRPMPSARWAGCTCENPDCTRPEHLVERTRGAVMKGQKRTLAQRARIAKAVRARAKLTEDQVEAIRTDGGTPIDIARRFGVHKFHINAILRNDYWQDFSHPFSELVARP